MKHPKVFRVHYGNGWESAYYTATEIRADEHWITLVDDAGNKLYLIKAALVEQVELINEDGND
jgi:hypothetical protein